MGPLNTRRLVQLPNISLRDASLLVIRIEDCRAILTASVVALTVQLRGIVRDGEVNLEKLAIADPGWIVDDFNHFGVIRSATANRLVVRCFSGASRIAGTHGLHAHKFVEDGFNTPEAAPGKNRCLPATGAPVACRRQDRESQE